jgi:hypothetical protein
MVATYEDPSPAICSRSGPVPNCRAFDSGTVFIPMHHRPSASSARRSTNAACDRSRRADPLAGVGIGAVFLQTGGERFPSPNGTFVSAKSSRRHAGAAQRAPFRGTPAVKRETSERERQGNWSASLVAFSDGCCATRPAEHAAETCSRAPRTGNSTADRGPYGSSPGSKG